MPDGDESFGYCDTKSGRAGCVGERRVRRFKSFDFCAKCWPHRKRYAKQLAAEQRRRE